MQVFTVMKRATEEDWVVLGIYKTLTLANSALRKDAKESYEPGWVDNSEDDDLDKHIEGNYFIEPFELIEE